MEGCLGEIVMSCQARIICFYKSAQHNSLLHYFWKVQISLMAQLPKPPSSFIALELPQPEGPSRKARIDLLLTLKTPQLSLLDFQTITLLLNEIKLYNDSRLSQLATQLKRQKKIKQILALTYRQFFHFSMLQTNQTLAIIDRLDDVRLASLKSTLEFQIFLMKRKRQMNKPKPTFTQNLKNSFPFSLLYPKQPEKKDEEQQLQLSHEPERTVGVNQFNFKYD